ncbi:MAG: protein kinase [Chloroflexi bacterium]|nr:protein kinase [Chloroflexota bacterium]
MLPQTIGRYQIKAELGRGGMSTVYLAHDPHFGRDVAVKLLPRELLHHPTFRRRFDREAKIVAALDHPAIVPVYDFGEQDEQPFLVMRFMAGGSLSDRLKHGPMALPETARILSRLAPALDEVHRRGVVHRDLKPSNILFDQRNEPFISDFGTAKFTDEHTKLTETGGAVGTPAYMSPEQIQGEVEIDGRSDIYTLGVILFEMLTGKHPYQTSTPIGLAVKHIYEPVPNLQDTQPNIPAACQPVIVKAMAKQREVRYQTAVAFAKALTAVAHPLASDSQPYYDAATELVVEDAAVDQAIAPLTARRWRWLALFLLLGLVILTGGSMAQENGRTPLAIFAHNSTPVPGGAATGGAATGGAATGGVSTGGVSRATPSPTSPATRPVEPTRATSIPSLTLRPTAATATAVQTTANLTATITLPASLFAAPDSTSAELAIAAPGEVVTIIGRAAEGNWLYVLDNQYNLGYVFGSRLEWSGDWEALSVMPANGNEATGGTRRCAPGTCAGLTLDLYPVNGRCEAGIGYRTIYLQGQGGDGRFTYFWNNTKLAGPISSGFGFEVNNSSAATVIGTGKVVSGDGQMAEKVLFVADFSCGP